MQDFKNIFMYMGALELVQAMNYDTIYKHYIMVLV